METKESKVSDQAVLNWRELLHAQQYMEYCVLRKQAVKAYFSKEWRHEVEVLAALTAPPRDVPLSEAARCIRDYAAYKILNWETHRDRGAWGVAKTNAKRRAVGKPAYPLGTLALVRIPGVPEPANAVEVRQRHKDCWAGVFRDLVAARALDGKSHLVYGEGVITAVPGPRPINWANEYEAERATAEADAVGGAAVEALASKIYPMALKTKQLITKYGRVVKKRKFYSDETW